MHITDLKYNNMNEIENQIKDNPTLYMVRERNILMFMIFQAIYYYFNLTRVTCKVFN